MSDIEINESLAKKVLATVDHGLSRGVGRPILGEMCVEAAVCYAMGEDHGDRPSCVGFGPRGIKVRINDNLNWKDKHARASGMRRLAVAQLGTINNFDSELLFLMNCSKYIFEKYLKDVNINPIEVNPKYIHDVIGFCTFNVQGGGFLRAATAYILYIESFSEMKNSDNSFIKSLDFSRDFLDLFDFMLGNIVNGFNNSNEALMSISEDIVQVFIEMESEGSKFLYLTEPPEIDPLEPML